MINFVRYYKDIRPTSTKNPESTINISQRWKSLMKLKVYFHSKMAILIWISYFSGITSLLEI
jgi:hypothetical protein